MKLVNETLKLPELQRTMFEMSKGGPILPATCQRSAPANGRAVAAAASAGVGLGCHAVDWLIAEPHNVQQPTAITASSMLCLSM